MSEKSKISWTDSTINFWSGCTKVSAGCAHCYAEARDARMLQEKVIHFGKGAPRLKSKSAVKEALRLNAKPWICDLCGGSFSEDQKREHECVDRGGSQMPFHRRRIFSLSLGDWLDDEVPTEWLAEMLDTVRRCDQVTWILCSKRWENFTPRLTDVMRWYEDHPPATNGDKTWLWILDWISTDKIPSNIIGLCSVENQAMADERIPQFLKVPLACRGLSLEPLIGSVDLTKWIEFQEPQDGGRAYKLDWLIIGGESGDKARPCNVDWIRSLVQQGRAAGVPVFVKQMGANPVMDFSTVTSDFIEKRGENATPIGLIDKKGGNPAEWPADLRVQNWPNLQSI